MKHLLLVFLGGGLGSTLRYVIGKWLNTPQAVLPHGTLLVNSLGCFIIGVVLGFLMKENNLSHPTALLLATGFCGGFTTFSAFAFENYNFIKTGDFLMFGIYTLGSLILGFALVFCGIWLSRLV